MATLKRLYKKHSLLSNTTLTLQGQEAHYLLNVMRLEKGDSIHVFNEEYGEWHALITGVRKKDMTLLLKGQVRASLEEKTYKGLAFCLLKNEALHTLLKGCTELGATDFYPLISDNTYVKHVKEEKAHHYIQEAVQQCERLDMPTLHAPQTLVSFLNTTPPHKETYVAWERSLEDMPLNNTQNISKSTCFLIGPEGGWSEKERCELFASHSLLKKLSLGDTVLRSETAAIACMALNRCFTF